MLSNQESLILFSTMTRTLCGGVKMLLSYLPSNNIENAPYLATDDPADRIEESLRDLVPEDPDKPYDVRNIILSLIHI